MLKISRVAHAGLSGCVFVVRNCAMRHRQGLYRCLGTTVVLTRKGKRRGTLPSQSPPSKTFPIEYPRSAASVPGIALFANGTLPTRLSLTVPTGSEEKFRLLRPPRAT